jgi:hypothetical protein
VRAVLLDAGNTARRPLSECLLMLELGKETALSTHVSPEFSFRRRYD